MELKSYSFKVVTQKEKNLLLFDEVNGLLQIQENGCVDLNTARALRTSAISLIEDYKVNKLLLNRKWLHEYTKEARKWIINDHYIRNKSLLNEHLELIATVKPVDSMGCIYAHLLSSNIKIFLKKTSLADFDQEADAMGWLLDI